MDRKEGSAGLFVIGSVMFGLGAILGLDGDANLTTVHLEAVGAGLMALSAMLGARGR